MREMSVHTSERKWVKKKKKKEAGDVRNSIKGKRKGSWREKDG